MTAPASAQDRGKAARATAPRRAHADWEPPARDPVALLERQAATRVPELVPVRHGRMLASPFAFYRGAALIMAGDLAQTPRSGIEVQLCGDAHVSNFGLFGTPERRLAFDLNDFDETHRGPWEWDVKRLAASLAVAGRERGLTVKQRRAVLLSSLEEYRTAMRGFASMGTLALWYAHVDADELLRERAAALDRRAVKRVGSTLAKARTRDSVQAAAKFTTDAGGEPRIISDPPLIVPIEELVEGVEHDALVGSLEAVFADYRDTLPSDRRHLLERYRLVHFARKVVGVGSVGTRAWIALFVGRDVGDPLFLQVKEAQASVLEAFLEPSPHANEGERVVHGQRLMQAASDIFLGHVRVAGGRDFYVRQLRDWKGGLEIERMTPEGLAHYGRLCGWTLARAHARSGDRVAIASYLGSGDVFDRAVTVFAELYADQNERDFATVGDAVESGRLAARFGL